MVSVLLPVSFVRQCVPGSTEELFRSDWPVAPFVVRRPWLSIGRGRPIPLRVVTTSGQVLLSCVRKPANEPAGNIPPLLLLQGSAWLPALTALTDELYNFWSEYFITANRKETRMPFSYSRGQCGTVITEEASSPIVRLTTVDLDGSAAMSEGFVLACHF